MEKIATEVQRSGRTISDLLELARSRRSSAASSTARQFAARRAPRRPHSAGGDRLDGRGSRPECRSTPIPTSSRVLINLLINAGQAMRGHGHIWIDAGPPPTRAHDLRVRDDGPGIPSSLREHVFEALFTTKAKGSGLGLALCRRITEAHEGTIQLEASAAGASFLLYFPLRKADDVAGAGGAPA